MSRYIDSADRTLKPFPIARDALLVLVALILIFGSFGVVSPGERGIRVQLGETKGVVESGPYMKIPIIQNVYKMNVRTHTLEATKENPLFAASNDLQDVKLSVVVNYHILPESVVDIYVQYKSAENYYSQVVDPLVIATIKATASAYSAAEQVQKRQEMTDKARSALQAAFLGKNVEIEKIDITNVEFSPAFTQAIEAKVTAVQNADAAKNKLEQVKYEAQQTIEAARGVAEAQRIQAQSLAAQGGEDYVALKAIEKWDGKLPVQMIPGSAVPFINLTK